MKLLKKIYKHSLNHPNNIAISGNNKISYFNFWQMANNLAFYLKKKKIDKICILENKEDDFICYVAMVASLISGGTYIPINNALPLNRLKFVLTSSKAKLLISKFKPSKKINLKSLSMKEILKLKKVSNIKTVNSMKDAYIIYTSGSTGKPKGVRISRNSLDHYIMWISKKFFQKKNLRCSQHPSIGFDLSVADIFGTLSSGGTLFPIQNDYDRLFLNKFIKKNRLTHWISVPSAVDLVFDQDYFEKNDIKSLQKMFFCGEVLKKIHLKKIFKSNKNIKVINSYGPTEATVSCTSIVFNKTNYHKYCKPSASFGKPINNMKIGFLSKKKVAQGEIYISGPQVARGYKQEKLLNKYKFKNINNKKSFITGDVCKIINGNYYFLNRIDRQVKILGNRIELNEIDKLIEDLTNFTSHSVIFRNKIFTFCSGKFIEKMLKIKLAKYLPKYMIPINIFKIKTLPRNNNQKIDENKLLRLINGKGIN